MRKSQLYSIAFGFSLLVMLSFSILLYNSITSFSEYSSLVEHTQRSMNNLQKVHSLVIDAETGQRGFLLTEDSTFLEPLLLARLELPVILDSLDQMTAESPLRKKDIDTLRAAIWVRLQLMQETLNRYNMISKEALTERLKLGKLKMDHFREVINKIMAEEGNLLLTRSQKKLEFQKITPSYFKAIISITGIVSLLSFLLLMRELRDRLAAQILLEKRFNSLNRSNAELQQITHVTSHDLQEPLRKIRTFSDALMIKYKDKLPEEVFTIINRIDANSSRMRELVADLSAFTSLSSPDGKLLLVNLTNVLEKSKHALKAELAEKKAVITDALLPSVMGYSHQLAMLFEELISNSLKFSKPDVNPVITITSDTVFGKEMDLLNPEQRYLVVTFSDNGIGFEKEYEHKIFILFQKLHGQEDGYDGKGLGLALCQRIMANHDGFITANGEMGKGASFHLYFPA